MYAWGAPMERQLAQTRPPAPPWQARAEGGGPCLRSRHHGDAPPPPLLRPHMLPCSTKAAVCTSPPPAAALSLASKSEVLKRGSGVGRDTCRACVPRGQMVRTGSRHAGWVDVQAGRLAAARAGGERRPPDVP